MGIFFGLQDALGALRGVLGEDAEATELPALVRAMPDEALVALIEDATTLVRGAEAVRTAAAGVVAARSVREAGHGGLAQQRGHRSPVSLIQDLTGSARGDAAKQVRLGQALAAGAADFGSAFQSPSASAKRPWHAPLDDALLHGCLTSSQYDAIHRGLGEPPACAEDVAGALRAAWTTAAEQLIDEAGRRTVEELVSAARTIRDLLDPAGAERRFEERFERRSFRVWLDRDGTRRGSFAFDDEGGAWVEAIIATALRPRRGGPRFVDPDEADKARALVDDPRTNEQLAYDLMVDVLRAGALADAASVFGTRQPGLRVVVTEAAHRDATAGEPAVALLEETDAALPGWLVPQQTCQAGTVTLIRDERGNPLDLGREARLYSAKQRMALSVRDGGCRITGCDRPASYCEAHHIDPFGEGGRTDIDRGILLCRFHHMNLHHHGWRITRDGTGDFVLHRPGAAPLALTERLARRYAFGDLQPPPRRFRPAA